MNFRRPIILASSSPRRQYLMKEAGYAFTVSPSHADESFPDTMQLENVPSYLAEKKAISMKHLIKKDEVIVSADTVVISENQILNKPSDYSEAVQMLSQLSGKTHLVVTAVCLLTKEKADVFDDRTEVTFVTLTPGEIDFYINQCKPFDKAGAYGAQDWLGLVGIEKINGSYFTVMGMPMHKVYRHLKGL